MRFKTVITIFLLFALLSPVFLFGGTTGKISGVVTDKETGKPLPGVAVSVEGTSLGSLTDQEGRYFIINLPVGSYSLKADLIGYATVRIEKLGVSADLTTYNDIQMSSRVLDIGQVQTVVAERPLVIMDQTASIRVVSKEEVQQLPTRGYQDVVGLSAGVVAFSENADIQPRGARENTNTPALNIRGGRQGEVAYYVDGFSQQDPLTNLSTTAINNNAIDEISISTGGFSAEYGWVSSGAINVATREGGKKFSGSIEGVTDGFMDNSHRYNYNVVAANVDGPVLPNNDKMSFFASMERRRLGDRSPRSLADGRLPHNTLSGWTWQGKLKYDLNPRNVLRLGTLGSRDDWREFRMAYYYNLAHAPRYLDENYSYYAKWNSTLSPKTFFELGGSYFLTKRIRGDNKHWTDLAAYGRPNGNTDWDESFVFWQGDTVGVVTDTIVDAETGDTTYYDYDPDDGHVWEDYLRRRSSYVAANFALTSQINETNELQFGLDLELHRLRYYNHLDPTQIDPAQSVELNYKEVDFYGYDLTGQQSVNDGPNGVKKPYTFAAYFQDKLEWRGLVVNAGIRYDYLNVKTNRLKNEDRPLDPDNRAADTSATEQEIINSQLADPGDFENSKAEQKISPRIGIGFPVSDKTVFHVNYGRFFQRPELQYLYVSTNFLQRMVKDAPYYAPIGNPNLEPEQTTAYEVGFQHQLGDFTALNMTAYFKDVKNLTEVLNQPSTPNSFATYRNSDFGTIKGLDFQLKMRRTRNISGELNYSLSYASGTGSYASSQSNIAWTNSERPLVITPLDFDQRHKITAIVDIRAGRKQGPLFGTTHPLENSGLNLVFRAASGTPYTPMEVFNEITLAAVSPNPIGRINSRNMPWTYRLDLKGNKTFYISRYAFDVYLWVINVFDTKNAVDVYEASGLADNTLWLATSEGSTYMETEPGNAAKYNFAQQNPNNYDTPRQIRLGLRMSF